MTYNVPDSGTVQVTVTDDNPISLVTSLPRQYYNLNVAGGGTVTATPDASGTFVSQKFTVSFNMLQATPLTVNTATNTGTVTQTFTAAGQTGTVEMLWSGTLWLLGGTSPGWTNAQATNVQ